MLCYVMLCYVMLCYVMLCNVMLCYVMLCCYVIYAHQFFQVFIRKKINCLLPEDLFLNICSSLPYSYSVKHHKFYISIILIMSMRKGIRCAGN